MESEHWQAMVLTAIALASVAVGAIHISAASTLGSSNGENLAFFGTVAAAQIIWGLVALVRPSRLWLGLGVLGNVVVMATWIISRTVALPFGPYAHVKLPVGYPDALATVLEGLIVIGAVALFVRDEAPPRAATRSLGATAAAVVLLGALAFSGVMSQANAFGSSGGTSSGGSTSVTHGGYNYGGSSGGGMTSGGSSGSTSSGGTSSGGGYSGGY
jgi:hypothetical protein